MIGMDFSVRLNIAAYTPPQSGFSTIPHGAHMPQLTRGALLRLLVPRAGFALIFLEKWVRAFYIRKAEHEYGSRCLTAVAARLKAITSLAYRQEGEVILI